LGLRNLQSAGLLPVQKASIAFNFKNMVPENSDYVIRDIETEPGPSGANPTIITKLEYQMQLPVHGS